MNTKQVIAFLEAEASEENHVREAALVTSDLVGGILLRLKSFSGPARFTVARMFWDAIVDGLELLTFWRTWMVIGVYGGLSLAMMLAVFGLASIHVAVASASLFVIGPIWNALALTAALTLLAPLLVVGRNEIAWDLLEFIPLGRLAIIALIGVGVGIGAAFLPIVGRWPSISAFAQGAAILGGIVNFSTEGQAFLWPGIWTGLGLAVVGGITAYVVFMAFAAALTLAAGDREELLSLAAPVLGGIAAIIPVFFYAGWIRQANGL